MHLAFMTPSYLKLVLDGKKTIESRFYGTMREHSAMSCDIDHEILFKRTGGNVEAISVALKVHRYRGLTPVKMQEIEAEFNDRICANAAFWEAKRDSRQGILIELAPVIKHHIDAALLPTSREGWLVLDWQTVAKLPNFTNPPFPHTHADAPCT